MRTLTLILAFSALFFGQSAKAQCDGVEALFVLETGLWANEIDFNITNEFGVVVFSLDNLTNQLENNSAYTADLCLPIGCYTLNQFDSFGDGWNGASITLSYDSTMVSLPGLPTGEFGSIGFGIYTDGCQGEPIENQIPGCTDPLAINFQPWATVDNGSCQYPQECEEGVLVSLYICTFSNGDQVQLELYGDNNELLFMTDSLSSGAIEYYELCLPADQCLNALMSNITGPFGWYNGYFWINYNGMQVATGSLGQGQEYGEVSFSLNGAACPYGGCTDPEALNYDEGASYDNGSCEYPLDCGDLSTATITVVAASFGYELVWLLVDENNVQIAGGGNYPSNSTNEESLCLEDGCYTLILQDTFGDGWNGGVMSIALNGGLFTYTLSSGNSAAYVINVNSECEGPAVGCTDQAATNYDPSAVYDDGSCTYPAPANDLCANATALLPGMQVISNVNAYQNENIWGECWAFGSGEGEQTSVWFTFTTPTNAASIHIEAIADGTNTLTDTQFGLFAECGGEMIYCDGNSGQGLLSAFTFGCGELEPNTTYILMIDGYYGDSGTCYLNYEVTECGPVSGCTDPQALNFNAAATDDDGSCIYPEPCSANELTMVISTQAWGYEIGWSLIAADGSIAAEGGGYDNYATYAELLCLEDGCYTIELYDSFGDGWNGGNFALLDQEGNNYASGTLSSGNFTSMSVAVNSECEGTETTGCTDPEAVNYNPDATSDDGSCVFDSECDANNVYMVIQAQAWGSEIGWAIVNEAGESVAAAEGVSDWLAETYLLCLPDGCYTLELYDSLGDGWNGGTYMLQTSNEVLAVGTLSTGSFDTVSFGVNADCGAEVFGCTDPVAWNFDPNATIDDGSCQYNEDCDGNLFVAFFQGELWVNEISWDIVNTAGEIVLAGNGYSNQNDSTQSMLVACLPNGCYTANLYDSFGDGWNGATLTLIFNGNEIVVGMPSGSADSFSFGINATGCADGNDATGCTDPEAVNYNPAATEDDGSCLYSQNGPQVNDFFDPMEVDLYPNPSEGNVNLDIFNGNGDEALSVQVYDLQGRIIYTRDFGLDQERLRVNFDANRFPAGVYLVQVINGTERHIERMVRQ